MFNCGQCNKPTGPRISPVMSPVITRAISYVNWVRDEEEELQEGQRALREVVSNGTEIVRELKLCPACSKVNVVLEAQADHSTFVTLARSMHGHAAVCNKQLSECKSCQRYAAAFADFPTQSLSVSLEETKKLPALRASVAGGCVEALMRRAQHNTKRSQEDFRTGYAIMKTYELAGGSL